MINFSQWMMSTPCSHEVTSLLQAWGGGQQSAFDQLVPLVYAELHRLAHHYMRIERPGHVLQTTALVNEAYLRLAGGKLDACPDRGSFLGICARVMRQVLVDWARTQQALKRQCDASTIFPAYSIHPGLPAIDEALEALAKVDPRKAEVVELKFFGGLSVEEIAQSLGVSAGSIARDWTIAKLFLHHHLSSS